MPQGLQVFNSGGALTFDSNARLTRVIGTLEVAAAGSLSHAGFAQGTPFCIVMNKDNPWGSNPKFFVSFSGTTMTWSLSAGIGSPLTAFLIYGIY